MSVLQECPQCRLRQKTKNKRCKCGADLEKAKRSRKVRFWVAFRLPDGKQRQESLKNIADVDPYSIEDARAVDGKRKVQRKERDVFNMQPAASLSFDKLAEWYFGLESVKALSSFERVKIAIGNFNKVFGDRTTGTVEQSELQDFFQQRVSGGIAASTASVELGIIKGMVSKAFDNNKVSDRVFKAFRKVKPMARRGSCVRRRTVSVGEYLRIVAVAPAYLRGMVVMAMNTGMRPGEVKRLRWAHIDRKGGIIRLPAEATKEGQPKDIPLNHHAKAVLDGAVRHLEHDFVFVYGGHPIEGPKGPQWALMQACKAAGVSYGRKKSDGLTMHDFRRTVKTNMARAGVGDVFRNVILGHSLQGMDKHYISLTDDDLKQAMAVYTAWLDNEIAKVNQTVNQAAACDV
jgi:integrase